MLERQQEQKLRESARVVRGMIAIKWIDISIRFLMDRANNGKGEGKDGRLSGKKLW